MEIALDPELPTYAGGLGMLAGDTLRSAADMKLPMCAVTLLHRKGYFRQELDESGWQFEHEQSWDIDQFVKLMEPRVSLKLNGRDVQIQCWRYEVMGNTGSVIPVYLLDTDIEENSEWDRHLTDRLYLGDHYQRICQEAVLGQGGVMMLKQLGHTELKTYHMNEGHAAFLGLELLDEEMERRGVAEIDGDVLHEVRKKCVFTTHTPVPAGHDQFSLKQVKELLGHHEAFFRRPDIFSTIQCDEQCVNMTYLALNLSRHVNGVAKRHAEVARLMFADYKIDSITNGVHPGTWVSFPFQNIFDKYIPGWREDNFSLRAALSIPKDEIWRAHQAAKSTLCERIKSQTNVDFSLDVLTLGYARRATSYKRPKLLFKNKERLYDIAKQAGGLQLVFAGKAHPGDDQGKFFIQDIIKMRGELAEHGIQLVYLEDYNMKMAQWLISGVDIWLNTPQPPMEASGTSGMKAAMNGVPSLSTLDGWWIEGCVEGLTGWAIESISGAGSADSLYQKLEEQIVPLYYERRHEFIDVMRHAIALNGSFFNTQRMMLQYFARAYLISL